MSLFSSDSFQITNPAALGSTCGKCDRHRHCESPRMKPYGKGKEGIMVLTDISHAGDLVNMPMAGDEHDYIAQIFTEFGMDLDDDVVTVPVLACEGKTPTAADFAACRGRFWSVIEKHRPRSILALGMNALEMLLGHRWNSKSDDDTGLGTITRWAGWSIPDRQTKCFITPTWTVGYIMKEAEQTPAAEVWFRRHIKQAIKNTVVPFPYYREENECVEIVESETDILKLLDNTAQHRWFTFDYETTGLKPYRNGHKIWYIGIGDTENHAYCFPTRGNKKAINRFCELLADKRIGKVAHNASYEDLWSRVIFGVQVENWIMDTIQAAHIYNQNPGMIGLKFLAYVRLGLVDYSSHVSPYLITPLNAKEEEMGANRFNRIRSAPKLDTMKYCAIDCLSTYRIAVQMDKEMKLECL